MFHSGEINWIAVIVAVIAYYALGALWYSPAMFAKRWMELVGTTEAKIKEGGSQKNAMIGGFFLTAIQVVVLAIILAWTTRTGVTDAILVSLLVGIGFVFTTLMLLVVYEDRSTELTMINVGYQLSGIVIAGLVMGFWP